MDKTFKTEKVVHTVAACKSVRIKKSKTFEAFMIM